MFFIDAGSVQKCALPAVFFLAYSISSSMLQALIRPSLSSRSPCQLCRSFQELRCHLVRLLLCSVRQRAEALRLLIDRLELLPGSGHIILLLQRSRILKRFKELRLVRRASCASVLLQLIRLSSFLLCGYRSVCFRKNLSEEIHVKLCSGFKFI